MTGGRSFTSEARDSIHEMLEADKASEIEERLAGLLSIPVKDLRDYMTGNIRARGQRRTGYTFLRGTHGGHYVRDPNGTDILPSGFQVPA